MCGVCVQMHRGHAAGHHPLPTTLVAPPPLLLSTPFLPLTPPTPAPPRSLPGTNSTCQQVAPDNNGVVWVAVDLGYDARVAAVALAASSSAGPQQARVGARVPAPLPPWRPRAPTPHPPRWLHPSGLLQACPRAPPPRPPPPPLLCRPTCT